MSEITLQWEGPFKVSELRKKITGVYPDDLLKMSRYSCLIWPGVYVFHDKNRILYVGQANNKKGAKLRYRLIQHINHITSFSERLRKHGIEISELSVIVVPFSKDDDLLDNISVIENALMCPCKPPGHFDEDIRITNLGNIGPLPNVIEIVY